MQNSQNQLHNYAGLFTLSLRIVIGWTYFSAFWRRLILENKLIPNEAGYIGEKFNHFLPNALGIKPLIEYLVLNPDKLYYSMVTFTIIEAIVGLFIILGLFTRLMSVGVFGLAMGILLGSGWIGTTCLDEWQIGVLGIASGFTLFLTGSGYYSLDKLLINKKLKWTQTSWFSWLGSGNLPVVVSKKFILMVSLLILGLTLFTNQYFHGGVFGKLHNKSVKPKIEISQITKMDNQIQFQIYRTEGADVYGSFLIGIQFLNEKRQIVHEYKMADLSQLNSNEINNIYVAKVKPGKHSLIIPLGAKADLKLKVNDINQITSIKLLDISGIEWEENLIK